MKLGMPIVGLCLSIAVGCTTKIAIGDESTAYWISPWRYWSEFHERETLYRQWAKEAIEGTSDREQQISKVLQWIKRKVASQPDRCLVIDDHIANVVKRGYGAGYQRAEVFTTLTTALGLESRWGHALTPQGGTHLLQLAFVKTERGWLVLDVTNGSWFETADGHMATMEDFETLKSMHPHGQLAEVLAGDGIPYRTYFQNLYAVEAGNYTRAHGQFFWDRIRLIFHVAPDSWSHPIRLP